ncbi:MAG: LysM peptidoglycan-binding domain-containing protein [Synechococcales cyanobacterium RM1_1_8]|nr:LysM peptidoglycan-binding domain-containing protein [Synechococcales cyanobacterium RM1_1_8]
MKRGFPKKIEPLLPRNLGHDFPTAPAALSESGEGCERAVGSVVDAVQRTRAEAIASVVRHDDGVDLIEGLIKPALVNSATQRRVRTSAAVMGLALSMGASNVLSVLKADPAVAAEANGSEKVAQRSAELALELQALAESAQKELEVGLYADAPRASDVAVVARSGAEAPQSLAGDLQVEAASSLHVVQSGETLYGIARAYGISLDALAEFNGVAKSSGVGVGSRLKVPALSTSPAVVAQANSTVSDAGVSSQAADRAIAQLRDRREALRQNLSTGSSTSGSTRNTGLDLSQLAPYRVQPGDTVDSIARKFSVDRNALIAINQIANPSVLKVDQNIAIPHADEPLTADVAAGNGVAKASPSQPARLSLEVASIAETTAKAPRRTRSSAILSQRSRSAPLR